MNISYRFIYKFHKKTLQNFINFIILITDSEIFKTTSECEISKRLTTEEKNVIYNYIINIRESYKNTIFIYINKLRLDISEFLFN